MKWTIFAVLGLSTFSAHAQAEYNLSTRAGVGMEPIYQGASKYTLTPIVGLDASVSTERWGMFSANETGLAWLLPLNSPWGVALLAAYDGGRDEEIRTSSGKSHELKGMGNLKAAPEVGLALSYLNGPYHLYLKGLRTVKKRNYGGEELGFTSRVELGGEYSFVLTDTLSSSMSLASSWGDSKLLQGHFGVTRQQEKNSQFHYYKPGSGIRDITYQFSMIYQFTPSFALQGAIGGYYLVGDAGRSPLTKSRAAMATGVALSYTF